MLSSLENSEISFVGSFILPSFCTKVAITQLTALLNLQFQRGKKGFSRTVWPYFNVAKYEKLYKGNREEGGREQTNNNQPEKCLFLLRLQNGTKKSHQYRKGNVTHEPTASSLQVSLCLLNSQVLPLMGFKWSYKPPNFLVSIIWKTSDCFARDWQSQMRW